MGKSPRVAGSGVPGAGAVSSCGSGWSGQRPEGSVDVSCVADSPCRGAEARGQEQAGRAGGAAWSEWRLPVGIVGDESRGEPPGSLVGHCTDSSLYFEPAGSDWGALSRGGPSLANVLEALRGFRVGTGQ